MVSPPRAPLQVVNGPNPNGLNPSTPLSNISTQHKFSDDLLHLGTNGNHYLPWQSLQKARPDFVIVNNFSLLANHCVFSEQLTNQYQICNGRSDQQLSGSGEAFEEDLET